MLTIQLSHILHLSHYTLKHVCTYNGRLHMLNKSNIYIRIIRGGSMISNIYIRIIRGMKRQLGGSFTLGPLTHVILEFHNLKNMIVLFLQLSNHTHKVQQQKRLLLVWVQLHTKRNQQEKTWSITAL